MGVRRLYFGNYSIKYELPFLKKSTFQSFVVLKIEHQPLAQLGKTQLSQPQHKTQCFFFLQIKQNKKKRSMWAGNIARRKHYM